MKIVFDIETVGVSFDSLSESQQEYLLRYAEKEKDEGIKEQKIDDAIRYLSLYPYTASIAAIAMLNTETGNTLVLYEDSVSEESSFDDKKVKYKSMTENEILETFWNYVSKASTLISFNGKCFDIPFLMLRSAILKVKPTRNFLKSRYDSKEHIDLLDKFSFYGLTRKFNLDFYCRAFGIESSKSKGLSGMDVKEFYNSGRKKEIAVYCADDVRATYELFKIWEEYLDI